MNKKVLRLCSVGLVTLSLVLAGCTPGAAAAQQATVSAAAATPAAEIAQTAKTAEANAQSFVNNESTTLPPALETAAANAATPEAAIVRSAGTMEANAQSGINGAATALPTTLAEAAQLTTPAAAIAQTAVASEATALPPVPAASGNSTPVSSASAGQPNSAPAQTIPVFSGFQPLAANDSKASYWLNTANQMAQKTGFHFDGKAYVTTAKVEDITAFYNNALMDWKATPPTLTSYPFIGNVTVWVYSQTSQQTTLTIAYTVYDAAASKFLVITELLWK